MKKKKIALIATSVALIGVLVAGITMAYFTDKDENLNVITMGNVNIDLDETGAEDRENTTHGKDYENVSPNEPIEKDPTVTIQPGSEDAYIRVSLEFIGDMFTLEGKEADLKAAIDMAVNTDDWYYSSADGYYYYQGILSNKESGITEATLFEGFTIPDSWGNEIADKTFQIRVTAEAIQADHFTPARDANGVITGWADSQGQPITAETYTPQP